MNYTFWESVAETPWWLYGVFFYLLLFGIAARKPRIVSFKQLFILPAIFVATSLITFYFFIPLTKSDLMTLLYAALGGAALGWLQFLILGIKGVKDQPKLFIPGTFTLFFIFLIFIGIKFYSRYQINFDTQELNTGKYNEHLMLVYGLFTGLFIGRLGYALFRLKTGPFIDEHEAAKYLSEKL